MSGQHTLARQKIQIYRGSFQEQQQSWCVFNSIINNKKNLKKAMSQCTLQFCFTISIRSYLLHEFLTTVTFSTILLNLAKRWGGGEVGMAEMGDIEGGSKVGGGGEGAGEHKEMSSILNDL